jgi:outer membrane murein-binding lipoprotein Lpp
MKAIKLLAIAGVAICGLLLPGALQADGTNTPSKPSVVVLSPNPGKLPADIRALLSDFDAARDHYQAQRKVLLEKLKGATQEQREEVRAQLQADRQEFLAEVAEFRKELRKEIADLKLKIHDEELLRLIEAGQGGGGHKGH